MQILKASSEGPVQSHPIIGRHIGEVGSFVLHKEKTDDLLDLTEN
jgi:hypothetical protein